MANQTLNSAKDIDAVSAKKPARRPLAKQSMGTVTMCLLIALLTWAFAQEISRDAEERMTSKTVLYVIVASYIYCDYWLWMLHCFLDRKENLQSKIPQVVYFATVFQDHHNTPSGVLWENHLGEIDMIVTGVSAMGLAMGMWTSPATKFIVAGICVWGSVGSLNHFYGHAITNNYDVPAFYKYGQQWGLLPSAKHHKTHHTAPFEMNWNFLSGFYKIYEALYFASGSSLAALAAMFYTCNPVAMQPWLLALGILA